MNTTTLFKFQSLVATVVFTLSFSLAAEAQTTTPAAPAAQVISAGKSSDEYWGDIYDKQKCDANPDAGLCPVAADKLGKLANCQSGKSEISEAAGKLKKYSAAQQKKYLNCDYNEGEAGEDNIEDDDLLNETARILAEGSEDGAKSAQAKQCGEMSGCTDLEEFNPAEILRDAQKDASDANKDLLEARQSLRENTKKGERSIVKIEQQAREDQRTYQNSLEKINQGLAAAEKKLNQEQREAVAKKRAELTAKQAELSGLNDALRSSELEVAKAQTSWTATCLKDANAKLEAEKAEQKKKYEDSKAKGEKRNYAGSSLAGAAKRKESTLKRRQQLAFNNAYKECIAGISPAGAAADQAIKDARAALEAAKVSIAEKKELIAKQVQDLMKDLIDQETAAAENRETLRKNAELQLKEATDAYSSSVERATILRNQAMEDLADVKSFGQEAITLATQTANQATGRLQMAESRVQCGGNKTVTSATASRNQTAYEEINQYAGVASLLCKDSTYQRCDWFRSRTTCPDGASEETAPATKPAAGKVRSGS